MTINPRRVDRSALFGKKIELKGPVVTSIPVIVCFGLRAFFLGGEHYYYADIVLPDDVPKVLKQC